MAKKARAKKGAAKAKGRKAAPTKKAAAPAVKHPYKVTPPNILVSLLNGKKSAKKKTLEISSDIGTRIAHAVEHNALNKKAFAVIDRMWNMDSDELRDHWDVVQVYFKDSGLQARYDSAPPLEGMSAGDDPAYQEGGEREQGEGEEYGEGEQTEAFPDEGDGQQVAAE